MNVLASLFNLGGPDLIIILVVVLLLFGAKRLPELARGLGQAMNEFNKAKEDMHRQIANADAPVVQRPREVLEHQPQTTAAVSPQEAAPAAAPVVPAEAAPEAAPQPKPQV